MVKVECCNTGAQNTSTNAAKWSNNQHIGQPSSRITLTNESGRDQAIPPCLTPWQSETLRTEPEVNPLSKTRRPFHRTHTDFHTAARHQQRQATPPPAGSSRPKRRPPRPPCFRPQVLLPDALSWHAASSYSKQPTHHRDCWSCQGFGSAVGGESLAIQAPAPISP